MRDTERKASTGGRKAIRLPKKNAIAASFEESTGRAAPQKRGDEVRRRILQASLECFSAFGFEGTSTRAVADRAGVTHTLIMHHFKNKDQLWLDTMDAALSKYFDDLQNIAHNDELTPSDALKQFITLLVRTAAGHPEVQRIITMERTQNTARLEYLVDTYVRKHFHEICELIRAGQLAGTVRRCNPTRLYFHLLAAGVTPFATASEYRKLTGRDIFSEEDVSDTIDFIYETVFTEGL